MKDVYKLYKRIMKLDTKAIDEIENLDQAKEIIKLIMGRRNLDGINIEAARAYHDFMSNTDNK